MIITPKQASMLKEQVATHLRYFNRLLERMKQRGISRGSDLYQATVRACAAVQDLHVACHYEGCTHGVAKREEGGWPEHVIRRA